MFNESKTNSARRLKFNSSNGPLWKWLYITSETQSTGSGMCVPFISWSKHLELVMMCNKYWKFILSKCLVFTKQIYKWDIILFDLCHNPVMWEMKNRTRKAMTWHAGSRKAVKKGTGLEPSFPGSCSGAFTAISQIKISILPLTQRCREGGKTKKTLLCQYWEKFRIHFEFLNKEFQYFKV